MKDMRKALLGFMMLLMLTPVLACAMAFCPMKSAQAAEMEPCHQSQEQSDDQQEGIMFALDCMGVDLFSKDLQSDVSQLDQSLDKVNFVWANVTSSYSLAVAESNFIRGPPFDANPPHNNEHNLYLTTQRFRV